MMGKSFELLGLAAFNVFIALILTVTFLSNGGDGKAVSSLTEQNVESFINEVAAISNGRMDMDQYAITSYLMAHVADKSAFRTTLKYTLPDEGEDQRVLEMDKINFIANILQGLQVGKAMSQRETLVRIEAIQIKDEGRRAEAVTTTFERGMMEMEGGMGDPILVPVDGTSYCEQTFVLSDRRIQMEGAVCTTDISFIEEF